MTFIVRGREGKSHIFEYGDELLGVMVMPETGTAHRWRAARAAFVAAGMRIRQNGDCEGTATFSPDRADQVRLALRYARARPRRRVSQNQKERLRELGFKKRFRWPSDNENDFTHTVERELMTQERQS
jgi:hypothetical protein